MSSCETQKRDGDINAARRGESIFIDCDTRTAGKAQEETSGCQRWNWSCPGCHVPFLTSTNLLCWACSACILNVLFFPSSCVFQWRAARTGQWTTWNTRCFWGNLYGLSALYSMDISGPTTPMHRAQGSALCGTKAQDTGTLRNPSVSMARGWARRRTPSGFDQRSWTTWATTPAY